MSPPFCSKVASIFCQIPSKYRRGILLPLFHTVNHMDGEVPFPTPGKMAPQLSAFLPDLLAVTTVKWDTLILMGMAML